MSKSLESKTRTEKLHKTGRPKTITERASAQYRRGTTGDGESAEQQAMLSSVTRLSGKPAKAKLFAQTARRNLKSSSDSSSGITSNTSSSTPSVVISPTRGVSRIKYTPLVFPRVGTSTTRINVGKYLEKTENKASRIFGQASKLPSDLSTEDFIALHADFVSASQNTVNVCKGPMSYITGEMNGFGVNPELKSVELGQLEDSDKSVISDSQDDLEELQIEPTTRYHSLQEVPDSQHLDSLNTMLITSSPPPNLEDHSEVDVELSSTIDHGLEVDGGDRYHGVVQIDELPHAAQPMASVQTIEAPESPGKAVSSLEGFEVVEIPESPGNPLADVLEEEDRGSTTGDLPSDDPSTDCSSDLIVDPTNKDPVASFERLTTAELREKIKSWGFKPVRGRTKMLDLVKCVTMSNQGADHTIEPPNVCLNTLSEEAIQAQLYKRISTEIKQNPLAKEWWTKILLYEPIVIEPFAQFVTQELKLDIRIEIIKAWCDYAGVIFISEESGRRKGKGRKKGRKDK